MANNSTNVFASEEYLMLLWLSEHLTQTNTTSVVKFSQIEIAQEQGCSPTTVNKRIQILQRVNCVEPYGKKGNYKITKTGNDVIKHMREIEKIMRRQKND